MLPYENLTSTSMLFGLKLACYVHDLERESQIYLKYYSCGIHLE
jgi:hypothetical protein